MCSRIEGLRLCRSWFALGGEYLEDKTHMHDHTPAPKAVRLSGDLETISASSPDIVLKLSDGSQVLARMGVHEPDQLRELFGKRVVVSGVAQYRASGQLLRLDVESIRPVRPGDRLFETMTTAPVMRPVGASVAQDATSGVAAFFGTWPGEETEEELLGALEAIG